MTDHVYKHIEITGSSKTGSDDAIRIALAKAHETVRNMQWFRVLETRGHVVDGGLRRTAARGRCRRRARCRHRALT